jgi:hypothetical protein
MVDKIKATKYENDSPFLTSQTGLISVKNGKATFIHLQYLHIIAMFMFHPLASKALFVWA